MAIRGFEQGIFSIMEGIVAGVGEKVSALGKAFDGIGSESQAAASAPSNEGFMSRMKSAMGLGIEHEIAPAEPVKLGRGAQDAAIVAARQEPQGPNHASLEEIGQLAAQFSNVTQQRVVAGVSMNA